MTLAPCTRRPLAGPPSARRRAPARGRPRWLGPVEHHLGGDGDREPLSPPEEPPELR